MRSAECNASGVFVTVSHPERIKCGEVAECTSSMEEEEYSAQYFRDESSSDERAPHVRAESGDDFWGSFGAAIFCGYNFAERLDQRSYGTGAMCIAIRTKDEQSITGA